MQHKCQSSNITCEALVLEGEDPRETICSAVDQNHADVLVVGTRGLGAIKRAIMGSVSTYCLDYAHCDVIVAK